MWMLWLTSLLTICVLTWELWSFPSVMIHTEEDKKWVDHRLLRADGISDGKSKLFPHISLAQKLEHVVWFSSLNSFSSSSWVATMFQGSAPDSCTSWQGKWAGEGSRDGSGSQWAAVLVPKALCMLSAFPSFAVLRKVLPRNAGGKVREQVPLVPVPSHHRAVCDVRGLDLLIQMSLVLHIRD